MGDLLNGANNAASAQTSGIQQGLSAATGSIGQGQNALNTNYTAALQPLQGNYANAQQGTAALGNVLGLNGAAGNQSANAALQTTPGYQFALRSGDNAVNAAAAANGTLNSGNQLSALSAQNQGLASQNYNNYASQLTPYLNQQSQAASGIAGVNTGLGNQTNTNYNTIGNMQYGADTSIGNANASADLANQSMFGNIISGGLKLATSLAPTLAPTMLASDERLKDNIEPVGKLYDGQDVYRYNYKGDATPRIGLMAQEVEKIAPEAVAEFGGGFKAVHYGRATDQAAELAKFFEAA